MPSTVKAQILAI